LGYSHAFTRSLQIALGKLILSFLIYRFALIMSRTGLATGKDLKRSVQTILTKGFIGDWFVLSQIGKNVNTYFYRSFLRYEKIRKFIHSFILTFKSHDISENFQMN